MQTVACPRCSGQIWVQDALTNAPCRIDDAQATQALTVRSLRWTCVRCSYQAKPDGMVSWRLGPAAHQKFVAAAKRSR
jgi:hypothetical protein